MRALLIHRDQPPVSAWRAALAEAGQQVDVVHNGQSGLDTALGRCHDVILLDTGVTGLDASDLCRRLRVAAVWTPLLMIGAENDGLDQADALELGADDYLDGPSPTPDLHRRISAVIGINSEAGTSVLVAGDLRLDTETNLASRDSAPIDLTPRELALLGYLIRNRGIVVSELDILQSVWDLRHDGSEENLVEAHVGMLRHKVDLPFGRTSIRTVDGAGYVLAADGG